MNSFLLQSKTCLLLLCFACAAPSAGPAAAPQKLTAADLVGRHLESIGNAEARAAATSRAVTGAARILFQLPASGELPGTGMLVSDGRKSRLAISISSPEYEGEHLAFDGRRVGVWTKRPGDATVLSSLVRQYDVILKEGLLGGILNTGWPLLDLPERQPKLDYNGIRKREGRQLHELRYRPRKGEAELRINLYFDPESHRHVLTEYRLVQPGGMAAAPGAVGSGERRYLLLERFEDFRESDGLSLPRSYRLSASVEGHGPTIMMEYVLSFDRLAHNEAVDPRLFAVP